jgi:hypothetical protein
MWRSVSVHYCLLRRMAAWRPLSGKLADELAPLIRDVKGATTSLPEGLDPDRLAR